MVTSPVCRPEGRVRRAAPGREGAGRAGAAEAAGGVMAGTAAAREAAAAPLRRVRRAGERKLSMPAVNSARVTRAWPDDELRASPAVTAPPWRRPRRP